MINKQLLNLLLAGVFLLYPALVYFGLQHYGPRLIAGVLLVLLVIRFFLGSKLKQNPEPVKNQSLTHSTPGSEKFNPKEINHTTWITAIGAVVLAIALFSGSVISLKFYPVIISFSLLLLFVFSLYYPPTVIEKIARLQEPDLPEEGVQYTRNITKIWCLFFLINGAIATYTTCLSNEIWALYNGLISYLLMGMLFAGEFTYRHLVLKRNHSNQPHRES